MPDNWLAHQRDERRGRVGGTWRIAGRSPTLTREALLMDSTLLIVLVVLLVLFGGGWGYRRWR
jgi:hypothetical protein